MPLFARNTNNDVLISIEYVKILLRCGYAIESVMDSLAAKDFGTVSKAAQDVMAGVRKGIPMQESFEAKIRRVHHKNLALFLGIIRGESGPDVSRRLIELSDRIIKETTLTVDTLIDNLSSNLNRLFLLMAFPLSIFFAVMLQDSLSMAQFDFSLPPMLDQFIIAGDILLMFVVLYMMRYK